MHTRKKFIFAGISLAAVVTFFGWETKAPKKETMKFLTQDGKLVEIDIDKLPTAKRAASKEDIKMWVKK